MTTTVRDRRAAWYMRWRAFAAHEPRLASMTLLSLLLMLPFLMAMTVDTRTVNGINIWWKPTKFAFSFVVYFATLVWFFSYLPASARTSRAGRFVVYAAIFASLYEMAWLYVAAAKGVPSHFNISGGWAIGYALAGVGATTLMLAVLVQGILIARHARTDVQPAMKLSLVLASVLSFVLTMVIAGYLSSRGGHWVGGIKGDVGGIPIFGWSQTGGDIRVAHFWALHAHQCIALAGVALARWWPSGARVGVMVFALLYAAFTVFTFVQALKGVPFVVL
jgi:hypothetical protein